ncbi:putative diacylglycerol kinase (ATP) [Helianthus annuus]|nr:putative diacylglycerol kinase (ATP) [Helianthus annuus]KAJ0749319.1 putative diacylglycerol kinase (ATP) [Helianthus annuus]KAJ0788502.1 putative diacylglycerol kinase (ATP) [Helianthus annuus]KAJ0921566.1 putative diacylglycerol kinase (ATP) [Helianthus annuus]
MEESSETVVSKVGVRSSVIESLKGFSFSGVRIRKDELRNKLTMPEYLRLAMKDAIFEEDIDAGKRHYDVIAAGGRDAPPIAAPEAPVVVFINSKSGGRLGPELKDLLQDLMSEEQVFEVLKVKPHKFIQFGLGCLEMLASLGDSCAKETRERLRVVVAGGDGTVGWVLGCLGELHKAGRDPVPPTAIVPLGTGNDLSRSFGWGGSFPYNWKTAIKKTLDKAIHGPTCRLDSWNLVISMPAGAADLVAPHSLKRSEEVVLDQDLKIEGALPEKVTSYQGVFYNYFSIGMDAQVAYGFHTLRNKKPYLAQGPISNKIIYSSYSCKQGWFFTPCIADPGLRGLNNILKLHVKRLNSTTWEPITIPSSVRSIVALNLHSYASGRNPWGKLKPEYLQKKGFVEAKADDGVLEVFGFKHGWHASFVMAELISAKHIAQASEIRFELRGGAWKEGFMQMDGEPWKQPMNNELSTFVDIKRVPFQSVMIKGE